MKTILLILALCLAPIALSAMSPKCKCNPCECQPKCRCGEECVCHPRGCCGCPDKR